MLCTLLEPARITPKNGVKFRLLSFFVAFNLNQPVPVATLILNLGGV